MLDNEDKLTQLNHAELKLVALEKSSAGNEVKLKQPFHVLVKVVPLEVSISGNEVKLETNTPCRVKINTTRGINKWK